MGPMYYQQLNKLKPFHRMHEADLFLRWNIETTHIVFKQLRTSLDKIYTDDSVLNHNFYKVFNKWYLHQNKIQQFKQHYSLQRTSTSWRQIMAHRVTIMDKRLSWTPNRMITYKMATSRNVFHPFTIQVASLNSMWAYVSFSTRKTSTAYFL